MKVTVCVGSSCHLKGSRPVIEELQRRIAENHVKDRVELCGAFCMKNCQEGVCVSVDGTVYSVTPQTAGEFFEKVIRPRL